MNNLVFDTHPLGILYLDDAWNIIRANQTFCLTLGYRAPDLVQQCLDDLVPPDEYQSINKKASQLAPNQNKGLSFQHEFIHQSGTLVHGISSIQRYQNEDGRPYWFLAFERSGQGESPPLQSIFRERNSHWAEIFRDAPLAIAILDPLHFRFLDANKMAEETLGYTREELMHVNPMQITPRYQDCGSRSDLKALELVEDVFSGRKPVFEWTVKHRSGARKVLEISINRYKMNQQPVIIAMANDITLRKEQEENIQKSEARFRQLFAKNPLMIFAISADGTILNTNEAVERELGYGSDQLIGQSVTKVFYPEDHANLLQLLNTIVTEHNFDNEWELRKRTKDGDTIWVKEIIRPIDWLDGKEAYIVSCENITARMQAEMERTKSEKQYRSIFENYLFGLMIVSSDHKITMVNPALQNLLGYSRDELLRKTWQDITVPEHLERCSQLVNELILVDKEMFTIEKQYQHKNGSQVDVRCFIRHVDHPSPDSFLVIIQDISDELKLLEKESQLNLQQSEIDHKNRELTSYTLYLSQKNQLLTSISDALSKLSSTDQRLMREQIQKLQNYITKNISREEDWDAFFAHFREVNPNFLDKLSGQYPKLTQKELKHCAYVRMRLSINDVADLLHISPKAVEVARYRIKKKMGLKGRSQRLSDVLERIN